MSAVVGQALFGVPWWQSLIIGFPSWLERATRRAEQHALLRRPKDE